MSRHTLVFLFKVFVATLAMSAAIYWHQTQVDWQLWSLTDRAVRLALLIAGAATVFFVSLLMLGGRPADLKPQA